MQREAQYRRRSLENRTAAAINQRSSLRLGPRDKLALERFRLDVNDSVLPVSSA